MKKDFWYASVCGAVAIAAGTALFWLQALTPVQAQVDVNTRLRDFLAGQRGTVTVDGATTFALTSGYVLLACTGAETINTITGGTVGMVLILEDTDTDCTLADDNDPTAANAIDLTGSANDTGAVAKIVALIYTGSFWMEIYESDN